MKIFSCQMPACFPHREHHFAVYLSEPQNLLMALSRRNHLQWWDHGGRRGCDCPKPMLATTKIFFVNNRDMQNVFHKK